MLAILFTILITFLITSLFGYVAHWGLHQSWAGSFNESHMAHHLKLYPANDFFSDSYRSAGKDSTTRFFALVSIPLVLLPIILGFCGILPIYLVILILVTEGIVGFLNDYLHNSFHISNHFLTKIPFIKWIHLKWTHLHYLHHLDMTKNYGIFTFYWDRIFQTFVK